MILLKARNESAPVVYEPADLAQAVQLLKILKAAELIAHVAAFGVVTSQLEH